MISWFIAGLLPLVLAYIPAQPTNSTSQTEGGPNITDVSQLFIQWNPNGLTSFHVSYQLVGDTDDGVSQGVSQGALVHFSENSVNETTPPTSTPWIALISCDSNATDNNLDYDIFTLARDKGAVSALLYSITYAQCIINPEFADPDNFDRVFDIFSTQSLTSAQLIEYQFGQIGASDQNQSLYRWYDSQRLNDSGPAISEAIQNRNDVQSGYLFATLVAYNATNASAYNSADDNTTSTSTPDPGKSNNTALAMIILYAITGCVSALFVVVIVSGAIRAIRHPERYGPRSAGRHGPGDGPQSRARGLTRAILDTFPIVKFGNSPNPPTHPSDTEAGGKDFDTATHATGSSQDSQRPNMEMSPMHDGDRNFEGENAIGTEQRHSAAVVHFNVPPKNADGGDAELEYQPRAGGSKNVDGSEIQENPTRRMPKVLPSGSGTADGNDVVPDSIGRETCPICIVDFEEGDDLRMLPCEGKHRFHQECVDPWLLELSSSCPICRQDFLALENMLSGEPDSEAGWVPSPDALAPPTPRTNRFSRYVRQAIRRRRQQRDEHDPTDPDMPRAAETSL